MLIAEDCFDLVDTNVKQALQPALNAVSRQFNQCSTVIVASEGLESFMECFRIIQGAEIWQSLGSWIEQHNPHLGPGINERITAARTVTTAEEKGARARHREIRLHLDHLMQPGNILCLPTSPRVAPAKNTRTSTLEVTYRYQAICLLSIAGLGGLPEITLPLASLDGLPVGISLVGARGSDKQLLQLSRSIMEQVE